MPAPDLPPGPLARPPAALPFARVVGIAERLAVAAAVGLHANGQETEDTIKAVSRLGAALGSPATLFPWWGELLLQTEVADGNVRLRVHAATPSAVSMDRVSAIMRCVEDVCDGRVQAEDAETAVATALALPPASPLLFILACVVGACALALIFGASQPAALALIALSAGVGAVVRRLLAGQDEGPVLQAFAAALLAGIVGAVAVRLEVSSTLRLVAVCPCMILVPGPHLLNGALDLVAFRVPLGASRLAFAALVLLAICAGLLIGLALGGTTLPVSGPGRQVTWWVDALAAGAAAMSYGVFFSMPVRMLAWPAMIGMGAHALRWWAMSAFGVNAAMGAGITCLLVGTALVPVVRRHHLPFAAVGFASVVSLMPGILIFRIGSALLRVQQPSPAGAEALVGDALSDAVTAFLIVVAMTLGLVVPKHLYNRLVALRSSHDQPEAGRLPSVRGQA